MRAPVRRRRVGWATIVVDAMDDGLADGVGPVAAMPDLECAAYDGSVPGGGAGQSCERPLGASYFQIDGRVACADCRAKVVAARDARGLSRRERLIMVCVYIAPC
jgi:hypothetical protein